MVHIEKHVEDYDRAIEFHGALDNQARSIVGLVGPLCDIVDSRPTILKHHQMEGDTLQRENLYRYLSVHELFSHYKHDIEWIKVW